METIMQYAFKFYCISNSNYHWELFFSAFIIKEVIYNLTESTGKHSGRVNGTLNLSVRYTFFPETLNGTSEKVVLEDYPFVWKTLEFWEEFKWNGSSRRIDPEISVPIICRQLPVPGYYEKATRNASYGCFKWWILTVPNHLFLW